MDLPAKAKILVVDDQPSIRRLLQEVFRFDQLEVLAVGDGKEAVEAARREKPAVALIDLKMPGQDGLETLRQLRASSADLPVVMMTALGEEREKEEAAGLGCTCFLTKPFDINEVRSIVLALVKAQVS